MLPSTGRDAPPTSPEIDRTFRVVALRVAYVMDRTAMFDDKLMVSALRVDEVNEVAKTLVAVRLLENQAFPRTERVDALLRAGNGYRTITMPEPPAAPFTSLPLPAGAPSPPFPLFAVSATGVYVPPRAPPVPPAAYVTDAPEMETAVPVPPGTGVPTEAYAFVPALPEPPPPAPENPPPLELSPPSFPRPPAVLTDVPPVAEAPRPAPPPDPPFLVLDPLMAPSPPPPPFALSEPKTESPP